MSAHHLPRHPLRWALRLLRSQHLSSLLRRRYAAYTHLWLGRLVFWGGAVGVGLLAVVFARLSDWLAHQFSAAAAHWVWFPLLLTPLGGATLVWLTRRYAQGAEGSGIPQTIASLSTPAGPGSRPLLSLRIALGKMLLGAAAVGCGYSLGREGPTVQVGACLMSDLHRLLPRGLRIRREHLVAAGGAAGIAAAFNTPLAGVVFAIEELSRGVESRMSGLVITAIVLAGVVSQALLGGGHYFGHILVAASPRDFLTAIVVASLFCGLAGGVFARMLVMASVGAWGGWLGRTRRERPIAFAILCGLLVAVIGISSGGLTFGSGYLPTQALLGGAGQLPWDFGFYKLVATLLSYLAGLPGGIFAPSLAVGAGLGHALDPLFADPQASGVLLVLCMVGFLAAVTQAPITSFVIVMEMVDGYSMVIALMAVALLASGVSRLLSPSLYHSLANKYALQAVAPQTEAAALAATKPR